MKHSRVGRGRKLKEKGGEVGLTDELILKASLILLPVDWTRLWDGWCVMELCPPQSTPEL